MEQFNSSDNECMSLGFSLFRTMLLIGRKFLLNACDNNMIRATVFDTWINDILHVTRFEEDDPTCVPFPIYDNEDGILHTIVGLAINDKPYKGSYSKLSSDDIINGTIIITYVPKTTKFYKSITDALESFTEFISDQPDLCDPDIMYFLYVNSYVCSTLFYLIILYYDYIGKLEKIDNREVTVTKLLVGTAFSTLKQLLFKKCSIEIDNIHYIPKIDHIITSEIYEDFAMLMPKICYVGLTERKN